MNPSKPPVWRLKKQVAEARCGKWNLQVDVRQPGAGIRLEHAESQWQDQLLGTPKVLVRSNEMLDPFARAGNLITAYPCSEDRIFGGELSYRIRNFPDQNAAANLLPDDDALAEQNHPSQFEASTEALTVELVYSIQTMLLDTQPQPEIVSRLYGDSIEFFEWSSHEIRSCSSPDNATTVLMTHGQQLVLLTLIPNDLHSLSIKTQPVESQTIFEIRCELPAEFLEKGVIRRFRACAICGTDRNLLFQAAQAFYQSEIPLTA
jgi:hypothetical protein